jgi:O-antigen ligase
MMAYNRSLAEAGVLRAGDGLHPPSMGARVSFQGGKPIVTDGPFAEAKELIAGYSIIDAASLAAGFEASAQVVNQDVRWPLWQFCLERIADRPLDGGGFGREAFKMLFPDYYRDHADLWHAHNMVLNKGIQMGIPGMAAFLALWIALTAACARGLRIAELRPWAIAALAMMAGIFVRNMADDFFVRDHALLFWLLAGASLGAQRQPASGQGAAGR